jgi:RHS repeat-associated protein
VYYYHGDHLGSAQVVTDYRGDVYEHIEYTPYGELWVEHAPNVEATPFRFTGKERDSETGLYYYGARYLNPQTGMWLSTDPAMGEYIPQAPLNDEARKYNQNLPGMGGIFNTVNLHVYHYAGNNPVRYIDPTGLSDEEIDLISKAIDYLQAKAESYIESLKKEASVSGRATASVSGNLTVYGARIKFSLALVVEYDPRKEDGFTISGVGGADIGLATPGQSLTKTGAEATIGVRLTWGKYEERTGYGLRNISLALNAKFGIGGVETGFEYRRQIVNFDVEGGSPQFTFFDSNRQKFGISGVVYSGGPLTINMGIRGNGF